MKRWLTLLAVVVVLVFAIGAIKAMQVKKAIAGYAAMPEPTSSVSTETVAYQDWTGELAAVGSLKALHGADLSSEVGGLVEKVLFRSGDEVAVGAPLLQLVADADIAKLHSLEATAELATQNFERDQKRFESEAISKAALDSSAATLKSAKAAVAEQAALVAKKTIRAPFPGRLGISSVNPGQYLNPGDKIITLQQLDPIHIDFSLPQQALAQLAVGQKLSARTDAFPGQSFEGQIVAIDPVVSADTRNISIRATVPNPKRQLLPGMFANVTVGVGKPQRYLTLPQTAITFNPYGATVFVIVERGQENAPDPNEPAELTHKKALDKIDADNAAAAAAKAAEAKGEKPAAAPPAKPASAEKVLVARQVFVTTGATRGDQVAVLAGIKEGDVVVSSGQLKLRNGTRVNIVNSIKPSFDAAPKPVDE